MSLANETKEKLQAQGWHIAPGLHTRMPFYAWKQLTDVPDCQSNEKPPCVRVEFYSSFDGDRLWESCEVRVAGVAGDVGSYQWVNLSAYSINPSELMERLPNAVRIVRASWIAACQT